MLFKSTVVALLAASASAKSLRPNNGISADSKAGRKLMSKARMLDQQNQQQDDDDVTWMHNYSIKYQGCSSLLQLREDAGGDDEQGPLYAMNLVKFALCDSSASCSSCGKGVAQYVVPMADFIDAYTESKMNAQEQACENVRENCYCDNANDDQVCENQCYTDAGLSDCIEYDGEDEFDAQEYLECKEMDAQNENAKQYDSYGEEIQYFVGAYCKDGFDINLGVFTDEGCSTKAPSDTYSNANYGNSLPFEKESMVTNDCISCLQVDEDQNNNQDNNQDNNQNNNQNQDYDIIELCENSYQDAAKCESGLSGVKYSQVTSGCDYINNILPIMEKASRKISGGSGGSSGGNGAAVAFAIIFAITTALFAAYSFFLYRKIHRAKVNLSGTDGQVS